MQPLSLVQQCSRTLARNIKYLDFTRIPEELHPRIMYYISYNMKLIEHIYDIISIVPINKKLYNDVYLEELIYMNIKGDNEYYWKINGKKFHFNTMSIGKKFLVNLYLFIMSDYIGNLSNFIVYAMDIDVNIIINNQYERLDIWGGKDYNYDDLYYPIKNTLKQNPNKYIQEIIFTIYGDIHNINLDYMKFRKEYYMKIKYREARLAFVIRLGEKKIKPDLVFQGNVIDLDKYFSHLE